MIKVIIGPSIHPHVAFGLFPLGKNYLVLWVSTLLVRNHSPSSFDDFRQKSLRRPIGANDRDHIFVRESAVHQIVQESRKRHEKLKIADWEVMYGEKISKSKLHKLEILRRNDPTCIGQRGSNILNGMKDKRFKYWCSLVSIYKVIRVLPGWRQRGRLLTNNEAGSL